MIKPAIIPDAPFGPPPHSQPTSISVAAPGDGDGWERSRTHTIDALPAPSAPLAFPKSATAQRRAQLLTGNAVAIESERWLWLHYLPEGALAILGGAPGCGKTTLALSLAAVVTVGGTWPDGSPSDGPGDVIFWSGEDRPQLLVKRLIACGGDPARLHILTGNNRGDPLNWKEHEAQIEAALLGLERPRLLICDPVTQIVMGDMHRSNEVRQGLAPLVRLASRFNLCALAITHFTKGSQGRDPTERILGSGAFAAAPRGVLIAAKNGAAKGQPHDRLLVKSKFNDAPDDGGFAYGLERVPIAPGVEAQRVLWGERLEGDARSLLARAEAVDAGDAQASDPDAELIALLRALLADGPRTPGDVIAEAVAAGFNPNKIDKVKARAGIKSVKVGMSGGWVWRLREDRSPSQALQPSQSSQPSSFPPISEGGEGVGA